MNLKQHKTTNIPRLNRGLAPAKNAPEAGLGGELEPNSPWSNTRPWSSKNNNKKFNKKC